jgi:eukaryotic-like serine/threonine-protein kinase
VLTPERWQKVRDVLEQALELAPEKRGRFLDVACSSDPSLRSEVQSLLSADELARSSFLESPPLLPTALSPGTKLGEYDIVSQIGSGGMGVVYRAKDLRLGRDVAIKVLPAHLSADPNRLKRFEQEAQSAAALNHPNILAVHQLGSYQGAPYLVSELLEGETLREVMKGGSLPQSRLMDYAEQISDGLNAAHEQGIIHRDLKPENLFVTKDNRVKILDFGLAKLAQGESESAETVATLGLQTHPGMIAGTVGYMSPEQVRGEKLDTRTDLFSFGVVLYEMATGKRPFEGDTSGVTFEAILNRQPTPPSKLNAKVPPELERIISKALEKDREVRYQHASDIRADLKRLKRDSESGHTASHVPATSTLGVSHSARKWIGLAAVGLCLAGIALGFAYWKGMFKKGLVDTAFQNLSVSGLTSSGDVAETAISPDGKYLAYISKKNGKHSIWVRQIRAPNPVQVVPPDTDDTFGLVFNPTGDALFYARGPYMKSSVYQIPTLGGQPRKVVDFASNRVSFSPDGQQLAYVANDWIGRESRVMVAEQDGSKPRLLYSQKSGDTSYIWSVSWSPTGRFLAAILDDPKFTDGQNIVLVQIDVTTGKLGPISGQRWRNVHDMTWLPDGSGLLLTALARTGLPYQIWAVSYPGGKRTRVSNDLNDYSAVSVSADGRNIVATQTNQEVASSIWVAPLNDAERAVQITNGNRDGVNGIAVTPDNRIVFSADHAENWDLFMVDADGSNLRQLTFGNRYHHDPTVCEQGKSVIYDSDSAGINHLWRLDLHSGGETQLTFGAGELGPHCGGIGEWVYYRGTLGETKIRFMKLPVRGGDPVQLSDRVLSTEGSPSYDEKYLAFGSTGKDSSLVGVVLSASSGELVNEYPVDSTDIDTQWTADNRYQIQVNRRSGIPNLWLIPVLENGPPRQLTHFTSGSILAVSALYDGKRIAYVRSPDQSNAVLFRTSSKGPND